jgi:hypothetical protein
MIKDFLINVGQLRVKQIRPPSPVDRPIPFKQNTLHFAEDYSTNDDPNHQKVQDTNIRPEKKTRGEPNTLRRVDENQHIPPRAYENPTDQKQNPYQDQTAR